MEVSNSASLIANAVEIGATTNLNKEQRDKYESFLQKLRQELESEADALLALEKMLKRPGSKGARLLFEEELLSLNDTTKSKVLPFAEQFLSTTKRGASDRVIITGRGNYIGNISGSGNLVIGDVSSNFQSIEPSSPSVQLTSQDRKHLREALLSAFPSESDLRFLMYDYMNQDLNLISHRGTYSQTVFELVRWAEATGRIRELVEFAHEANPNNSELNAFISRTFPELI
jgi:hypothetical protein